MTVRTIHEYGSLGIERDDRDVRLTRQQANLLEGISDSFKRGQKDRLIDWYRSDEMRWRQYVGVVQIGDLTLEILPKIARHAVNDDADRAYLLRMLAESGMLPIAMDELANFTTQKWTLLDLVIYSFALEVKKQLHRGRIQRYEFVEEERSTIRGKLLVGKHARRDPIRQLRFPCRFSKFTPNTSINRLLRTAAREGWKLTQHAVVRQALAMKPDIVIGLSNGPDPIVVDTKWKLLDTSSTYAGVAQADAYQMYAYMDRYNASKVILLYPHHPGYDRPIGKQAEYRHSVYTERTLEVWTVDVEAGSVGEWLF
ncbi:MAG: hypothetical protein IPM83_03380 [Ignavibacteria bacterium]|nr:hypothetical protein [Ignavibacteria bacterium]